MRKLDYLRKLARKTKYVADIEEWELPVEFRSHGDDGVRAFPWVEDDIICGVIVEHRYCEYDSDHNTWYDCYCDEWFRLQFPQTIIPRMRTAYCTIDNPTPRFIRAIASMTEDEIWGLGFNDVETMS